MLQQTDNIILVLYYQYNIITGIILYPTVISWILGVLQHTLDPCFCLFPHPSYLVSLITLIAILAIKHQQHTTHRAYIVDALQLQATLRLLSVLYLIANSIIPVHDMMNYLDSLTRFQPYSNSTQFKNMKRQKAQMLYTYTTCMHHTSNWMLSE